MEENKENTAPTPYEFVRGELGEEFTGTTVNVNWVVALLEKYKALLEATN